MSILPLVHHMLGHQQTLLVHGLSHSIWALTLKLTLYEFDLLFEHELVGELLVDRGTHHRSSTHVWLVLLLLLRLPVLVLL